MQTADALQRHFPDCPCKVNTALRERHLGCMQGQLLADSKQEGWAELMSQDDTIRIPGGGESRADLQARCRAFLDSVSTAGEPSL